MRTTKATRKDVGTLLTLMDEALEKEGSYFARSEVRPFQKAEESYRSLLRRRAVGRNGVAYIAKEGDNVCGFSFAYVERGYLLFKDEKQGYIRHIFVRPKYRGRGIGHALIRETLDWFRKKGVKRIVLDVNTRNRRARKLYESLGFKEYFVYYIKDLR
jgi:ribosomal protein S18 acetylase RimI-like enzyme